MEACYSGIQQVHRGYGTCAVSFCHAWTWDHPAAEYTTDLNRSREQFDMAL